VDSQFFGDCQIPPQRTVFLLKKAVRLTPTVSDISLMQAWLEKPTGERIPLNGPVSFGRIANNQIVLPDEKVSRRHALVHPQGEREFWAVDLGSRNGTYVNQRRLSQPIRLRDGDQIQVGPFSFVFRQASANANESEKDQSTLLTLVDVRALSCWLLVADIESSTDLAKSLPPDELAIVMGRWLLNCKRVIEANGGTVNKYLGDGFLAYWRAPEVAANQVAGALNSLHELQTNVQLRFRFVVHRAEVTFGGVASLGEESLSGTAVNFVFRMEKVASTLGQPVLLSESASSALGAALILVPLGEHPVPSFEGLHRFFSLQSKEGPGKPIAD
jgi:adenylate cyclase